MAALLTSDQDDIDRVAIEVTECREMGLEVLPPNVNESFEEFRLSSTRKQKNGKIRFGLKTAVKNVGHTVAHEIVEEKKKETDVFLSLANLIERVESKPQQKNPLKPLAKVGALGRSGERNQIVLQLKIFSPIQRTSKNRDLQTNQFIWHGGVGFAEIQLLHFSRRKNNNWLGRKIDGSLYSGHPASVFQDYFEYAGTPSEIYDAHLVANPGQYRGSFPKSKRFFLKNQKTMLFALLRIYILASSSLFFPKFSTKHPQSGGRQSHSRLEKFRIKTVALKLLVDTQTCQPR